MSVFILSVTYERSDECGAVTDFVGVFSSHEKAKATVPKEVEYDEMIWHFTIEEWEVDGKCIRFDEYKDFVVKDKPTPVQRLDINKAEDHLKKVEALRNRQWASLEPAEPSREGS